MISLYFHIPFCVHRCAYCDFNTYAGQADSIPAYVAALCNEIKVVGESASRPQVGTIFFGGGTPTLLTPAQYRDIFQSIHHHFDVVPSAETSLEANPGTVSPEYLQNLREIGFNRISYGMQSANPNELRLLERIHTYEDVLDAVRWSRQAGFDNLNLDLIYGLPEQTLENWQRTVQLAVDLRPEHISAYALTIEPGTPFGRWAVQGKLPIPDPDLAADMYEWTLEFLAAQGYEQYEISNWARENAECRMMNDEFNSAFCIPYSAFQCRHNLQYWRNLDYLGLGAGAHGYAGGFRYSNALRIKTYIDRLKEPLSTFYFPLSPAVVHQHKNSPRDDMQETMITGLRLTREGVSAEVFQRRFGVQLTDVFGQEIDELLNLGLLEWHEARLRLTPRARLLSNQVFIRFVGD